MTDKPVHAGPARLPILIGVLFGALVLRGFALHDDMWFEEIWNWWRMQKVGWPTDILFKDDLRHDNNHILVTVWMKIIGDRDVGFAYRFPSLVAGLLSIYLVMDPRRGVWGMIFPGVVFAISYWGVIYSTEARGYAMALCCCLAAYRILEDGDAETFILSTRRGRAYWALMILGFLAHPITVQFFLGAIAWSAVKVLRKYPFKPGGKHLLWLHGIPLLFLIGLWAVFFRPMIYDTDASVPLGFVVQNAAAWTAGVPNDWFMAGPAILGVIALAGMELRRRAQAGSAEWVVLPVVLVVAPLLSLIFGTEAGLKGRSFLIGASLLLLYAARTLVRFHVRSRSRLSGALLVLAIFSAGNFVRDVRFIHGGGRGSYKAAVQHMSRLSSKVVRFGGDHFERTGILMTYYRRFVKVRQKVEYWNKTKDPEGPDWFISHTGWSPESLRRPDAVRPAVTLKDQAYDLVDEFGHYGPSGFTWRLYRRRQRR